MGLFEAIFGKGAPKDDTQPKQAYFLSDDDAKTFGNIEYMRSSKTVRRTFARKKGETGELESVRQISATNSVTVNDTGASTQPTTTFSSVAASFSTPAPAPAPTPAPAPAPAPAASEASAAPAASEPAPEVVAPPEPKAAPVRRSGSNDMDMFRNMAKQIRK